MKWLKPKDVDKFPMPPYLFKEIEPHNQVVVSCRRTGEKVWESVPIQTTDGEIRVIVFRKGILGLSLFGEPRGFLVLKSGEPVSKQEAKTVLELLFVSILFKEDNKLKAALENFIANDLQTHYQFLGDMVREAKVRYAGDGIEKYFVGGKDEERPDIHQAFDQVFQMTDDVIRLKKESVKSGGKLLKKAQDALSQEVIRLKNLQEVFDQFIYDSGVVREFYRAHINAEVALANLHVFLKNVIAINKEKEAKGFALKLEPQLKAMKNAASQYKVYKIDKGIYESFQDDMLKRFVYILVRNQ
ncbi:MAG: hypothetical protein KGZ96_02075 [Clostridia bacterium]|jgi:hypothetical protein|nr:hypothetical protein [Clostridia bacterium]